MKRNMMAGLVAVALGITAVACTDGRQSPVAPREGIAAPQMTAALAKQSKGKVKVNGIEWRKKLERDMGASALIGPAGGVLSLPATGLRLVVPAGAVSRPTQFGVTALEGKLVAYDFEPAGSVFPVALRVEQDPSFIDTKHVNSSSMLAGYFPSRTDLDQAGATGNVAELIPTTRSSGSIVFSIWHFSGYMMSWGLADSDPNDAAPEGSAPYGY